MVAAAALAVARGPGDNVRAAAAGASAIPGSGGPGSSQGRKRMIILALGVAAAILVVHLTPLKEWVANIQEWKTWIERWGISGPAVFLAGAALLVACGLPRTLVSAAAGMLFGFIEGVSLALIGSVFGSYGTFLFAHWGGRHWAETQIERYPRLKSLTRKPGIAGVFLIRQLPLPGIVPNLFLGVIAVPHRKFLIGTALGYLPSTIIVALIGSGVGKASLTHSLGQISASLLALALFSWLIMYIRRRVTARRETVGDAKS